MLLLVTFGTGNSVSFLSDSYIQNFLVKSKTKNRIEDFTAVELLKTIIEASFSFSIMYIYYASSSCH